VEPGLRAAAGGTTAVGRTASFTTVGLPSVASTEPANGATAVGRFGISIRFATPMDPVTLEGKLGVSGFDAAQLEGRVFADERMLNASLSLRPPTSTPSRSPRARPPDMARRWAGTASASRPGPSLHR